MHNAILQGMTAVIALAPELLVLQRWEDFTGWLLESSGRWPKHARFTLTQRIQNHAVDVAELLVQARFEPAARHGLLPRVQLMLERLRHLFRLARRTQGRGAAHERRHERVLEGRELRQQVMGLEQEAELAVA